MTGIVVSGVGLGTVVVPLMANWLISDLGLADRKTCQEMAIACSEFVLSVQRREGYWEYPNSSVHSFL